MQIVSNGDNLHEMSNLDLWENMKLSICRLLNNFSESVVKVEEDSAIIDRLLNRKKSIIRPFFLTHIKPFTHRGI